MAAAGFYVGVTSGPGKKKEISLASAKEDRIAHCKIKTDLYNKRYNVTTNIGIR